MATLGEAFINVRADLKPFTKDLARDLKVILNAAEKEVARRGKAMGKALADNMNAGMKANIGKVSDTVTKTIGKKKIKIPLEVDHDGLQRSTRRGLSGVATLVKGAMTSIGKRIADTFASLGRFISGAMSNAFSGIGSPGGGGGGGGAIGTAAMAGAIGVLVSILMSLIPAALTVAQAVGTMVASLAVIPAVGAAAAVSMGVLNLAFMGFDKAISAAVEGDLEAFNEALKDLSPSARAAAKALQPALSALQPLVQEAFFSQLVRPFRELGKVLRSPAIRNGIDLVARSLGDLIGEVVRFISSAEGMEAIQAVFDAIYQSLAAIRPVIKPLSQAIASIVKAGSGVLPTIANALALMAQHFADFIAKAEETGDLERFFESLGEFFTALGPAAETIIKALADFLGWAVKNPDAIVSVANAFATMATVIGEAFKDPQVVASLAAIVEVLGSIEPEEWQAIADAITRMATALGLLGAVILAVVTEVGDQTEKFEDWIRRLLGITEKGAKELHKKAAAFKAAGRALIMAFFDGMKSVMGNLSGIANAIVSRMKSAINSAISRINVGLDVAFGTFHISAPNIPFLAKGGIIDRPTLAMVGEKGAEAVVPLNDPGAAAAVLMKSGLMNMMSPLVQVFLGTEQLEQRMYRVVERNNASQATALRHGPRTV